MSTCTDYSQEFSPDGQRRMNETIGRWMRQEQISFNILDISNPKRIDNNYKITL
jgi:hypothetical protein